MAGLSATPWISPQSTIPASTAARLRAVIARRLAVTRSGVSTKDATADCRASTESSLRSRAKTCPCSGLVEWIIEGFAEVGKELLQARGDALVAFDLTGPAARGGVLD